MAIPPTAARMQRTLDPHEELDWKLPCAPLLEEGEQIADYALTVLPEAALLGLTIMSGDGRDHDVIDGGRSIGLWLTIDQDERANVAFDGGGVSLPVELTIETSSTPARTRNRTFLVPVAQL